MRCALLVCALAMAAPGIGAAAPDPAAAGPPGLVRVPSRTFDELQRQPGADLRGFRRFVIDTPQVTFRPDWLKRMNESRSVTRRIEPADADQIAERLAGAMQEALAQALAAQGFERAPAPAPGVLQFSPSVTDLVVYSPFVPAPGIDVGIVHREAGEATMRLEVRDASSGTVLARIADHAPARTLGGFEQATSVSNLFWFEGMFRNWAGNCVRELRSAPR